MCSSIFISHLSVCVPVCVCVVVICSQRFTFRSHWCCTATLVTSSTWSRHSTSVSLHSSAVFPLFLLSFEHSVQSGGAPARVIACLSRNDELSDKGFCAVPLPRPPPPSSPQLLRHHHRAWDPHAEVHPPGPDHGDREGSSQSASNAAGRPGNWDWET